MSHEGKMRRGKRDVELKRETADAKYFQEQMALGNVLPEDKKQLEIENQKKNEKSLTEKIWEIFAGKKSPGEKLKEIEQAAREVK